VILARRGLPADGLLLNTDSYTVSHYLNNEDNTSYPVLELSSVSFIYPGPPPLQALYDIDLIIRKGEYVSIVGPSGSGKSTFLNLVGLLDRPTSGQVFIDGIDVGILREKQRCSLRANKIGFVFQSFHLLAYRSASENVMLAQLYVNLSTSERKEAAYRALEAVGLKGKETSLPSELSGGERQRVAIARALVNRPSLLLCDEPTGNLDTVTTEIILDLFDELSNNKFTILVVTHNERVASRAQRSLVFTDGRLSETN